MRKRISMCIIMICQSFATEVSGIEFWDRLETLTPSNKCTGEENSCVCIANSIGAVKKYKYTQIKYIYFGILNPFDGIIILADLTYTLIIYTFLVFVGS